MANDVTGRRVRALAEVTVHVAGYGMIVMSPVSADDRKRFPFVPESAIANLVIEERISDDFNEETDLAPADDAPAGGDIAQLRATYVEVMGKNPFPGWSAETLSDKIRAKMLEDAAEQAPADDAPADGEEAPPA